MSKCVTVYTQAYNVENYIEQCIKSVLSQTFQDFEWILVENGSTDKTREIIRKYAALDERIKPDYFDVNQDGFTNYYIAEKADGRYIVKIDSDDWIEPEYLEKLIAPLEDPDVDISICGAVNYEEETGRETPHEYGELDGVYSKSDIEKQSECRKKIWEASGFLLELINEVLDMGKLESEEVILERRSFNFFQLFQEIRMVIEKQARERGINIVVHKYNVIHEDLIGSPVHVKRVVMNILTNAIKYNKNNGKICIEFNEIQKNYNTIIIRFKCEDTGIGMSESFQKTIYEPFAQEKAGARTVYGGTGLGMSITKSLVEKMGGTISFESEQGVGTTFYIELPFQIDHNIKHEELKTKEIKKASIKGVNVLLAEDNELNMEIAEFVLESAGANVIKAFNGKEALEIFKESKLGEIDIILMDVMMPVMDGLEAARYIRWSNKENARDIPIIAMTANAFTEDRRRVLEAGMNEHLAKPLESEVLIKTIANYCGKVDHFK